jgi:hypothetical protein
MKTGQGENWSDEARALIDPVFGIRFRFPNETHLFLPHGGTGEAQHSVPPHKRITRWKISGVTSFIKNKRAYIRLFIPVLGPLDRPIGPGDYPIQSCSYVEGDENCKKLKDCPGCDFIKFRVNLWWIPSERDEYPWLCKQIRIDPFTGQMIDSTDRYCKFCHADIPHSTDPRVKFCSPACRYEHQKAIQKERRQIVKKTAIRRCKHCGGILSGRQKNWCGDQCRKNEQRLRGNN